MTYMYSMTTESLTKFGNQVKELLLSQIDCNIDAGDVAVVVHEPGALGKLWAKAHGEDLDVKDAAMQIVWRKRS